MKSVSEVIFRLPSKAVQYGYVEVHATPEELGDPALLADPDQLGALYARVTYEFLKGEQLAMKDLVSPSEPPPGDPQAAADRLAAGEKPRTVDEDNEMAKQLIEKELGATVISEKPWENKVEPKRKPWENDSTPASKAAAADFDW